MPEHLHLIELEIMAHRYLYYVQARPIVSDYTYDALERSAKKLLPETSPVHLPGSDLVSDYTAEMIDRAMSLNPKAFPSHCECETTCESCQ